MTPPHVPRRLTIATRQSALALWQARHVKSRLCALYPRAVVEVLGMTTHGDQAPDPAHAASGRKGLYIRELENAMLEARADLAVHALKGLPADLSDGFMIAAIAAREDARDALVSERYASLEALPEGAVVGTSSLRREAQLRERHPRLTIRPLRGNLHTRLCKLDAGEFDAIILAAAGLKRLGLTDRIRQLIDPSDCLPAPGQGAIAIECRTDRPDVAAALTPLADAGTTLAVSAERAFSRVLAGSCRTPLAAHATWQEGTLWLRGLIASRDGREVLRDEVDSDVSDIEDAEELGRQLAGMLLDRGAARLIDTD